jgi:hypothetical protein
VEKLEGAACASFHFTTRRSPSGISTSIYAEAIEDVLVLAHECRVGAIPPKVSFPGTEVHDARLVPAHAVASALGKHDRAQSDRQSLPIGQDRDEVLDVLALSRWRSPSPGRRRSIMGATKSVL